MGQRTATRERGGTLEDTGLEDLRRQLEGGFETLEAATAVYRALSTALRRRAWKAGLRTLVDLVAEARAREPGVLEALAVLRRRAERAPDGSAQALLRKVEKARDALAEAITRLLPEDAFAPLAERLERLQVQLLQPLLPPPGEGEHLLRKGHRLLPSSGVLIVLFWPLLLLGFWGDPRWAALLFALVLLITWLTGGRYQLTSERLLLRPHLGKPVEVPLASIGDGELSVRPLLGSLRLRGHGVTLRHLRGEEALSLARLLSIRRRKEFRQLAASREPESLILHDVQLSLGSPLGTPLEGFLVLRPGLIAFLPCRYVETYYMGGEGITRTVTSATGERSGGFLLNALTEPTAPWDGPDWQNRDAVGVFATEVAKHLALLPGDALDRLLRGKAAQSQGSPLDGHFLVWEPAQVEHKIVGVPYTLHLSQGPYTLTAPLGWSRQEADSMMARWPRREGTTPSGPGAAPGRG